MGFFSKVFGRGKKKEDEADEAAEAAPQAAEPAPAPAPKAEPKPKPAPRAEAAPAPKVEVNLEPEPKVEVNLAPEPKVEVNLEPQPVPLDQVKAAAPPEPAPEPAVEAAQAPPQMTPLPEQRGVPEQASAAGTLTPSSGGRMRATSGSHRSVANHVDCDGCHRELPVPLAGHSASVTCPFCLTRNAYRP